MDVVRVNGVLVVEVFKDKLLDVLRASGSPKESIMAVVHENGDEAQMRLQHGTMLHFHRRLGHM